MKEKKKSKRVGNSSSPILNPQFSILNSNTISLGAITAEVILKDIKNIHLSVYPPNGKVRIAAPLRMELDTIRVFAISKLGWIKQQQKKLREQERETPREYLERESHYLWGQRYLLKVIEKAVSPKIFIKQKKLWIQARPDTSAEKRAEILAEWYREQIRQKLPDLLAKWEPILGVKVNRIYIRHMRTKWGSCNPSAQSIRLNTELAKKPPECLEYIVVHEIVHMLEKSHNHRFVSLMDHYLPKWRYYRDTLNTLPIKHENWDY